MKAAIVTGFGLAPVYGDFAEPMPGAGDQLIHVTAAAISQVVRARASGGHYSAAGIYPFVAGIDGVGRLDDGSRVYFVLPEAPFGSMAERVAMPAARCLALPEGLEDTVAAALANPGMSSWAALVERARLQPGETVLVNGATGVSGRLAVQIAKYLGAGRVIATGRNAVALQEVATLGADQTLLLGKDAAGLDDVFATGVDVVLDYLWGPSALALLVSAARAGAAGRPVRFVQIGSSSGDEVVLPSAVLRSSAIMLMGSGIGSIPLDRLFASIGGVLRAAVPGGFRIATATAPLAEVALAWAREDTRVRQVLTLD